MFKKNVKGVLVTIVNSENGLQQLWLKPESALFEIIY